MTVWGRFKMSVKVVKLVLSGQAEVGLTLRRAAQIALACDGVDHKVRRVQEIDASLPVGEAELLTPVLGRAALPVLVHPREVPTRSVVEVEGRGMLLHALAHIEFNAINLALDLMVRFDGMPVTFYQEWMRVAKEEALHHELLCKRLTAYGLRYGDYPAHDGLWRMAEKTKDSLLARLALVPRLLEARGLDVSPGIRAKLQAAGDLESAAVLDVILRDEIGHVAIGNHWFNVLCDQAGLDPVSAFEMSLQQYCAPKPRAPFNYPARERAGFTEQELAWLQQLEFEQIQAKQVLRGEP
jgi:uncharacterized ferritin-like protein (DUF455 family)